MKFNNRFLIFFIVILVVSLNYANATQLEDQKQATLIKKIQTPKKLKENTKSMVKYLNKELPIANVTNQFMSFNELKEDKKNGNHFVVQIVNDAGYIWYMELVNISDEGVTLKSGKLIENYSNDVFENQYSGNVIHVLNLDYDMYYLVRIIVQKQAGTLYEDKIYAKYWIWRCSWYKKGWFTNKDKK